MARKTRPTLKSAPHQPEDQAQDETDQDASPQGEVKGEILPFDDDVPRQPAQPGNLGKQQQRHPQPYQDDAQEDKKAGHDGHRLNLKPNNCIEVISRPVM